jgi:hypothetical protein
MSGTSVLFIELTHGGIIGFNGAAHPDGRERWQLHRRKAHAHQRADHLPAQRTIKTEIERLQGCSRHALRMQSVQHHR